MHSVTFTEQGISRQINGNGMKIKLTQWLQNQKEKAQSSLDYILHSDDLDAELYRAIMVSVAVWYVVFALSTFINL